MSTKKLNIWKNRLTLELLGMCAAALLIAIAAANLARNIAVDWIYNVVYSDEKMKENRLSGDMKRYGEVEEFLHFLEISTGARFNVKNKTIVVSIK